MTDDNKLAENDSGAGKSGKRGLRSIILVVLLLLLGSAYLYQKYASDDPEVGIVLFRDAKKLPVASLSVFALHLDTVGGTEYSADYPGHMGKVLQSAYSKRHGSDR